MEDLSLNGQIHLEISQVFLVPIYFFTLHCNAIIRFMEFDSLVVIRLWK